MITDTKHLRELAKQALALLDENERLRERLRNGPTEPGDLAERIREELKSQLAAMTAARDEACAIADRHIFAPTASVAPSQATTTEMRSGIVVVDSGAPYRVKARIAALRKVGAP